MDRIVVSSRVASDGTLKVTVPVGLANAGREVRVTVEPIGPENPPLDEWRQSILATAGKWQGDFNRPDQREFEQRTSLS